MDSIPTARIIEKLDRLLDQKDFNSAEKHLEYWLNDAKSLNDKRGMLTIANEQIGFYRKTEKETEALSAAETALELINDLGLSDSTVMGTTLINAATAYKAFNHADRALPYYEKAKEIYEAQLSPYDSRLGGLYNNMALALSDLGKVDDAEELFNRALEIMTKVQGGEAEMAITWCNLADLYYIKGKDKVKECLEKAFDLLNSAALPHNGYYAFVCEKCASAFACHGYRYCEKELLKRARKIYERS